MQHDRLRGQVEHHLGFEGAHGARQRVEVADVARGRLDAVAHVRQRVQARLGRRRQTHSRPTRAPSDCSSRHEPASLETGVAGDEDALAVPEVLVQDRTPSMPVARVIGAPFCFGRFLPAPGAVGAKTSLRQ